MKNIPWILILVATTVFAAGQDGKFNQHKERMEKNFDEQIGFLQTAKNCVSSATDGEGLKQCHEALEKARKQHKAVEIDEEIHHLQQEKDKLNKSNR